MLPIRNFDLDPCCTRPASVAVIIGGRVRESGASPGGGESDAFLILAADNLACVSWTPSLVLFIEKALLLGVVGMRRPALVPLAVAAILVDRQGLLLFADLALGPPLGASLRLLHLLLRGVPLVLALGTPVPTVLGIGGRVRV